MHVLSGTDISGQVLSLIERSKEGLLLVSAYFHPWDRLSTEIKRAVVRKVNVNLLLRGGDEQAKHAERAAEFVSIGARVHYLHRLHAKIYISESEAIVTSLNLVKSSAIESWEIGIRVDRNTEPQGYLQVAQAAGALLKRAKDEADIEARKQTSSEMDALAATLADAGGAAAAMTQMVKAILANAGGVSEARTSAGSTTPKKSTQRATKSMAKERGTCIRCAASIPLNPAKPLCNTCFKAWAKWSNPDYQEAYCHACGTSFATTSAKPLCRSCWRSA